MNSKVLNPKLQNNNICACVEVQSNDDFFKKSRIFNPETQVLVVYNDYNYTIDDLLRDLAKFDWTSIHDTLHISIQNCLEIDSLYCASSDVLMTDNRIIQFFVLKLMVIYDGSKDQKIFTRFINSIISHGHPIMVESIMNPSLFDHLYNKRGFRNDLIRKKSSLYTNVSSS